MVESAQEQGYPSLADIEAILSDIGVELITDSNTNFEIEEKHWVYGMMAAIRWAITLRVYESSDTTFKVVGGKYLWGNTVKTYATEDAVDPTDNDTTYVWMTASNTIGSGVDGDGWPTTEHIPLAEVVVDSDGVITSITDLRGESFLRSVFNVLYDGGASVEALPVFWDSPSPADNDEIRIPIYANNDADEKIEMARITIKLDDVSDGSEDASVGLSRIVAGVLTSIGNLVGTTAAQTLTNKTLTNLKLTDATELTIASGAITGTQAFHKVDTESDAASDDLDTITATNYAASDLLLLIPENAARVVTIRDGTGNINLRSGDYAMSDAQDALLLRYGGSNWNEVARSATPITNVNGGNLQVTTSNMAVPFILTATLAAGNTVQIYNANAPFKFEIIEAWSVAKSGDGGTWKLTDGTNDITNTVSVTGTDKTVDRVGTIDDAYSQIAASGSLNAIGDGSLADADIYVLCVRVS